MFDDQEVQHRQEALRAELGIPRSPELGDELFTSGGAGAGQADWESIACVNWDWSDVGYVEGYRLAADILVERVEASSSDKDMLVYPICFLYRQYLELAMKAINRDGRTYLDWPPAEFSGHNLIKEWKQCRPTIEAIFSGPVETIEAVESYVGQFASIDRTGMAFRYRLDRAGALLMPKAVNSIDLHQLKDHFTFLHVWFSGIDTGINEYMSWKQEAAEYARDAAAEAQEYDSLDPDA